MKDRILQIMDQEGLTPSAFADAIGIKRAAMSHITSGRNNPSLDVFTKILERFTYISPDWLLLGTGNMQRETKYTVQPQKQLELFPPDSHIQTEKKFTPGYPKEIKDKTPQNPPKKEENEQVTLKETPVKKVVKIIIYYSDKTFDTLIPEM